ncbi:MAG TPA: hypothetical protein VIX73_17785 [Kofleriaceae bacterium]
MKRFAIARDCSQGRAPRQPRSFALASMSGASYVSRVTGLRRGEQAIVTTPREVSRCSTDPHADADQASQLVAQVAEARWSDAFTIEPHMFAAFVAARLSPGPQRAAEVQRHAADLYLACGCALRMPGAVRSFEAMLRSEIGDALRHMNLQSAVIEDVYQTTLERVIVGEPGRAPRIADYAGHGALRGWTRVVVTRIALDALRSRKPEVPLENAIVDPPAGDASNPEMSCWKDSFCPSVKTAFDRAMQSLTAEERLLLRQRFVDGLSMGQLATLYRKHRITMLRRVNGILNSVRIRMQAILERDLGCGSCTAVSIVNLALSRANLSVLRYLAPPE